MHGKEIYLWIMQEPSSKLLKTPIASFTTIFLIIIMLNKARGLLVGLWWHQQGLSGYAWQHHLKDDQRHRHRHRLLHLNHHHCHHFIMERMIIVIVANTLLDNIFWLVRSLFSFMQVNKSSVLGFRQYTCNDFRLLGFRQYTCNDFRSGISLEW